MQFNILINQARALEWGLNSQQAMLFAFLFNTPTWATAVEIEGVAYCNVAKTKVVQEMPLLTSKPDTVYRLMKQLEEKGLVRLACVQKKTYVSITQRGAEWNQFTPPSKDTDVGKKSEDRKNIRGDVGKISEEMSEKSPTNHSTKYQGTNYQEDMLDGKRPTSQPQSVFIYIPTNRFNKQGEQYPVTDQQVFEWQETYPAVNVPQTLKRIRSWNMNNPPKRKTIGGMPAHIDKWLAREQNKGGYQNGQQSSVPGLDPDDLSWVNGPDSTGQDDQSDIPPLEGDFSRLDGDP